MLEVDVHPDGLLLVALLVEGRHLVAHHGEVIVRGLEVIEERGPIGDRVRAQLGEVLDEVVLRHVDLLRVRLLTGQQRHGAVVALRRDLVDHLPRLVGLPVERRDRLDLFVHPAEHEDAEDAHREQEKGDHEESGEQLGMEGRPHPRNPVDEGAREAGQRTQVVSGLIGRYRRRGLGLGHGGVGRHRIPSLRCDRGRFAANLCRRGANMPFAALPAFSQRDRRPGT